MHETACCRSRRRDTFVGRARVLRGSATYRPVSKRVIGSRVDCSDWDRRADLALFLTQEIFFEKSTCTLKGFCQIQFVSCETRVSLAGAWETSRVLEVLSTRVALAALRGKPSPVAALVLARMEMSK